MEDNFLISLREENAKSIGVTVREMDEMDLHEIEERLKIEVGELRQPMGSAGGYLISPIYGVENEKEREERKKRVERRFFSEKARW
jgi:tetrahydromethanopterin S-methyltransferase subunit G